MAAAAGDGDAVDPRATTIVQVAAGEAHSLALTASGQVYAWGRGLFGRLGSGVLQDEHLPTLVEVNGEEYRDDDSQSSHSEASYSLSTRDDARSREREREREAERANRSIFKQIAAGSYHSLALAGDGTVWSWGFNAYGQLGRERAASFPAPVNFPARSFTSSDDTTWKSGNLGRHDVSKQTKVLLLDAGGMVSGAVDQEGGLWLWGQVPPPSWDRESLKDNAEASSSFALANVEKPERVRAFMSTRVYRVACGSEHIVALAEGRDGVDFFSWGMNAFGQLGLGDTEPRAIPTLVAPLAASQVGTVVDIACGAFHTAVITARDEDVEFEMSASSMRSKVQASMMGSPKPRGRQITEQYMESPKLRPRPGERYPGAFPYPGVVQHSSNGYGHAFSAAYSDASSSPKMSSRASSQVSVNGGSRLQPGRLSNAGMDSGRLSNAGMDSGRLSNAGMEGRLSNAGMEGRLSNAGMEGGRMSMCWTFGQGENGQLGHGTTSNINVPTAVDGLPNRERLRTVVCGLFHTGTVTETGDVWVWGMEGGLGLCPGIGPPGAKSGDALTPVRVFGESSAKCNPVTGSKGIACGAAHTITVSNNGRDIWAWGRGQSGVLGLGHASDSWFPCPVVWPPGSSLKSDPRDQQPEMEPMYERVKPIIRAPNRTLKPRSDDVTRLHSKADALDAEARPPRSMKPVADFVRPSRRGDDFRPTPREHEDQRYEEAPRAMPKAYEDPRYAQIREAYEESRFPQKGHDDPRFRDYDEPRYSVDEPKLRSSDIRAFPDSNGADDVSSIKAELDEYRRYAEALHAAVFGGLDSFPYQQLRDGGDDTDSQHSRGRSKSAPLVDWQRCIELAADQELVQLELFYKGMRNRIKDVMFQRRMEDWCRRCLSALSTNQFQEPPPVRDSFSAQSTPSVDGPGEFAMRMSGILTDRGEMLPPAALAASLAEFRMLSQRRR